MNFKQYFKLKFSLFPSPSTPSFFSPSLLLPRLLLLFISPFPSVSGFCPLQVTSSRAAAQLVGTDSPSQSQRDSFAQQALGSAFHMPIEGSSAPAGPSMYYSCATLPAQVCVDKHQTQCLMNARFEYLLVCLYEYSNIWPPKLFDSQIAVFQQQHYINNVGIYTQHLAQMTYMCCHRAPNHA